MTIVNFDKQMDRMHFGLPILVKPTAEKILYCAMYPGEYINLKCSGCSSCKVCLSMQTQQTPQEEQRLENEAVFNSVDICDEANRVVCDLPLISGYEDRLADTFLQAKQRLKSELQKLSRFPQAKRDLQKSFLALVTGGFIRKTKSLSVEDQKLINSKAD